MMVLQHKKGLVTEPRFQKMTDIQWMFHYREAIHAEEKEMKKMGIILEQLRQAMQIAALHGHPDADYNAILNALKLKGQDHGKDIDTIVEETTAYLEEYEDIFPRVIEIERDQPSKFHPNVPRGKLNRTTGIVTPVEE